MKILVVSPVPTDPPNAGNRVRIATLAQALATSGHDVHFAYVPMEQADTEAMAARFSPARLHMLPWARRGGARLLALRALRKLGRLLKLDAGYMLGLDEWYDERITHALRDLHAAHRFDAVLVEYVFMSKALQAFGPGCLRLLDAHDSFGMRHRHYLASGLIPQWYSTSLAGEEAGFRRADVVLAIEANEARAFARRLAGSGTSVVQVGHLIDIGEPVPPSDAPNLLFVGSGNLLNVQGARFFSEQVLPLIRKERPDVQLLLAGGVAAQVPDGPGIVKLGFVPRLQQAFAQAMVFVNPVLAGTGVNIKLLDALAAGMPIVSTTSGARGLDEHGSGAFAVVADIDALGFAREVVKLIGDANARARLRTRAHDAALNWNTAQLASLHATLDAGGPSETVTLASLQFEKAHAP
ncbi:glycosyltransferase family 4 protein [Methylibium petroleiphilum]|uniref:Glycosyltransferase n=1 Tax=Methylibium petroleiphilum (strain ATCC BAA-1232 / LMG 22953 / PM1) TaxID=420662 RepID=A2SDQ6_METPP|nr:glycosyltransferase family 4 protein [Methylibium petroleiphilum]ABM93695.1 conserved hypothetical protein [Methylibium petroleiphilum PM1]